MDGTNETFATRWNVTLLFNGRLTGSGQAVRVRVCCDDALEAVREAERYAVRQPKHGGSICITGHTVEIHRPLSAQVAKWNDEWLQTCDGGPHWGDKIAWDSAMEIARRLDDVVEL